MRFDGTFPAVPLGVGAIRKQMTGFAVACGLDEAGVADVALAVSEAATNAIMHAYAHHGGDGGVIRVAAARTEDELEIVIADDGSGMAQRSDSPGAGLGLPIIAAVVRRMEVVAEGNGTELHMVFACPRIEAT